ncbi:MAG: rod shape determining protein RodA [Planctomycetota bacterium]|jgi:rod shape determining protein RodA
MSRRNAMRRPSHYSQGRGSRSAHWVRWHEMGWHILFIGFVLLGIGVLFISEMAVADEFHDRSGIRIENHIQKLIVAAPCLVIGIFIRPSWLRRHAGLIYALSLALLLAVPFIGVEHNNARRWIETPAFDIQPSEFAKLAIILVLARVLCRNRLTRFGDWVPPVALALIPMGLVALQPDLGTAMTIVPVAIGMFYLAGARGWILITLLAIGAGFGLGAWKYEVGVKEYQLARLDTWVESIEAEALIDDRQGPGFHSHQSRTSIGEGYWRGKGLGAGIANETGVLPERESDSVFAVIAGETGFVGATALLLLYGLLVILLMLGAGELRDRFTRLVVGGVAIYFASHVVVHCGVNLGLIPMTGLTLPLVSTGGSSLLVSLTALGLAVGLSANQEPSLDGDAFSRY